MNDTERQIGALRLQDGQLRAELKKLRRQMDRDFFERTRRLEAEILRQAAIITDLREQLDALKATPPVAWWLGEYQRTVERAAEEAAGK